MADIPPTRRRTRPSFPTLTDLQYRLASGRVTSTDLTTCSLRAIEASQPTLNAFRVVLTQQALADAAEADRKRAAGQNLPLLGIPIAVKDDVDVAGVPTRFGTSGEVRVATADAEVVRRLRAAGAIVVGKTNTCELGQWPFTQRTGLRAHPQPLVGRAHPWRFLRRKRGRRRRRAGNRGDRLGRRG